jgi:hypothetical protein
MLRDTPVYRFTDPAFSDAEFRARIGRCSPDELAQCVRLLGMYLALYKRQFGELEVSSYAPLANRDTSELALAELAAEGMDEASAMLMLIQTDPPGPGAAPDELPLN